jgi:hypothetical protein
MEVLREESEAAQGVKRRVKATTATIVSSVEVLSTSHEDAGQDPNLDVRETVTELPEGTGCSSHRPRVPNSTDKLKTTFSQQYSIVSKPSKTS